MKRLEIGSVVLLAVFSVFVLNGCLAMAAGYGIAKVTEGDEVYVCQNAPNASGRDELVRMMKSDSADYVNRSGEKVKIIQKKKVQINDKTRDLLYVESEDFDDRRYWVPLSAICRSE